MLIEFLVIASIKTFTIPAPHWQQAFEFGFQVLLFDLPVEFLSLCRFDRVFDFPGDSDTCHPFHLYKIRNKNILNSESRYKMTGNTLFQKEGLGCHVEFLCARLRTHRIVKQIQHKFTFEPQYCSLSINQPYILLFSPLVQSML